MRPQQLLDVRRDDNRRDVPQLANALSPAPAEKPGYGLCVSGSGIRVTDVSRKEFEVATPCFLATVKDDGGEGSIVPTRKNSTNRNWKGVFADGFGTGTGSGKNLP